MSQKVTLIPVDDKPVTLMPVDDGPVISQAPEETFFEKATQTVKDFISPHAPGQMAPADIADAQIRLEARQKGMPKESYLRAVNPQGEAYRRTDRTRNNIISGAVSTVEGMAGSLEWLTNGAVGQDLANQAKLWSQDLAPEEHDFSDSLTSGIGSMATFFVPGMGVVKGAGVLAKVSPRLASWFGSGTAAVMEAMTEAGQVYRDVLSEAKDVSRAETAATKTFWLNVPLLAVTNKLGVFGEKGSQLKHTLTSMAMEGTQEGGQEIISSTSSGKEVKLGDVLESAAVGAVTGGLFSIRGRKPAVPGVVPVQDANTQQTGGSVPPAAPGAPAPAQQSPTMRQVAETQGILKEGEENKQAYIDKQKAEVQQVTPSPAPVTLTPIEETQTETPATLPTMPSAAITEDGTKEVTLTPQVEQLEANTEIAAAANEAATSPTNNIPEPTPAQQKAGNYKKGHVDFQGLDISIENPAGSIRKGVDEHGNEWETELAHHYGYIKKTTGNDGDHVDVFISPEESANDKVFIVDQKDSVGGAFDEHKVMLGFDSKEKAKQGYLENYDESGKDRIMNITEMSVDDFKGWLKNGDQTKPSAQYSKKAITQVKEDKAPPKIVEPGETSQVDPANPLPAPVTEVKEEHKPSAVTKEEFEESKKIAALIPEARIAYFIKQRLDEGESITKKDLWDIADAAYGGRKSEGKYTPKDAHDAMEMGINQHIAGVKEIDIHANEVDAQDTVSALKLLIDRVPTQTTRTEEMNEFQQFSTPPPLAYTVNWVANITKKDDVFEPSAGIGGIASFAKGTAKKINVNELSSRRKKILEQMGFDQVFGENAEQIHNILPKDVKPSVVIMNPPFSSTAGRKQGERKTMNATLHIGQALSRLEEGGRLVAIVGEGMAEGKPTFNPWWNDIKKVYNVRANIGINGNEYKKYGTTFGNQIIIIDKTGPTTGKTLTGQVDKIEDLIPLLKEIRDDRGNVTAKQEATEPSGKDGNGKVEVSGGNIKASPNEVYDGILEHNSVVTLANGWKLARRKVQSENRIEVMDIDYGSAQNYRADGLYAEQINYNTRWFIPTDQAAAEKLIGNITKAKPIVAIDSGNPIKNQRGSIDLQIFGGPQIVNATRKLMDKINPKAANNVSVKQAKTDLGFLRAVLLSPGTIPGKARYYVVHGKNAILKQERLRGIINDKMAETFGSLNEDQMKELESLEWMGDAEGVNYSATELEEMGVSEAVKVAYLAHRKFHEQAWRMMRMHRKTYGANVETMQGLKGHVPHLFENWNVYEMVDKDVTGKGGEPSTVKVPENIVGTFRSLKQATEFANSLDPQKEYIIKPKAFRMPDDMVARTVLKDSSYFKMVENVEKDFTISRDEAHDMVKEIARRKNRHRFLGNLMKRKGQTGFRVENLRDIFTEYYNGVARYIAMDDFKARAIPKFERDFGVELGRANQSLRDKNMARYIEDYINDLNGVPGMIEDFLNASIMKAPFFASHVSSQRPAVWMVNKLMHVTAILKLGLFNLSSGVVNMIQLTNTFSQLPVTEFASAFGKVTSNRLTASDRALLRRLGIKYDLGLTDTGGYSAIHKGGTAVNASLYFFRKAEYLNRAISGLAAYNTGLARDMSPQEARLYARQIIDKTQFDYSVADTSMIFRNPAGRFFGQFKPYAIKQMEFITGLKGVENIKFWIPTLLLAGTAGIPMIEGLSDLIEWITGVNPLTELKEALMKWAGDDKAKKAAARVAMYGVASALNVDVSRRIGTGDIIPKRPTDLLGPTSGTLLNAKKIMEAGDKSEFVKSLAPSVGNLLTAVETVANGMEVTDPYHRDRAKYEATAGDVITKASGFRPVRESELADVQGIATYERNKYTKLQQRYIDKAIESLKAGNAEGFAEAITKAAEKGVVIDSKAIENEIIQKALPQNFRMILHTRRTQRGNMLELNEFLDNNAGND